MSLILAALLGLQDPAAGAALKRIEESIEKAATIRVTFRVSGAADDPKEGNLEQAGRLLVKGDKFFFSVKGKMGRSDTEKEFRSVSDGKEIWVRDHVGEPFRGKASPHLRPTLIFALSQQGLLSLVNPLKRAAAGEKPGFRVKLNPSTPAFGQDEGKAKTLRYACTTVRADQTMEFTLSYLPEDLRLLKRTTVVPNLGTIVETYEEFAIDPVLGDEEFKLPEGN